MTKASQKRESVSCGAFSQCDFGEQENNLHKKHRRNLVIMQKLE